MGGDQQQFLMGRLLEEALIHFVRQSEGKEPPDRDEEEGEEEVYGLVSALASYNHSNSR